MSQRELSELLQVHQTLISLIERGETFPRPPTCVRFLRLAHSVGYPATYGHLYEAAEAALDEPAAHAA